MTPARELEDEMPRRCQSLTLDDAKPMVRAAEAVAKAACAAFTDAAGSGDDACPARAR